MNQAGHEPTCDRHLPRPINLLEALLRIFHRLHDHLSPLIPGSVPLTNGIRVPCVSITGWSIEESLFNHSNHEYLRREEFHDVATSFPSLWPHSYFTIVITAL